MASIFYLIFSSRMKEILSIIRPHMEVLGFREDATGHPIGCYWSDILSIS